MKKSIMFIYRYLTKLHLGIITYAKYICVTYNIFQYGDNPSNDYLIFNLECLIVHHNTAFAEG